MLESLFLAAVCYHTTAVVQFKKYSKINLKLCVLFLSLQSCEGKSTLNEQIHWADGFVVVYDISDRSSFITATAIIHLIRELNLGAAKRYMSKTII